MQTEINLQIEDTILGYDRNNTEKVKNVFRAMSKERQLHFKRDYEILLNNIKLKKPYAMPWMKDSWEQGLKLLNEVLKEKNCVLNTHGCVYHACMGSGCQKEIVLAQGINWGRGKCQIVNQL